MVETTRSRATDELRSSTVTLVKKSTIVEHLKQDTRYQARTCKYIRNQALDNGIEWHSLDVYTRKVRVFFKTLKMVEDFNGTSAQLYETVLARMKKGERDLLFKENRRDAEKHRISCNMKHITQLKRDLKTWKHTLEKYRDPDELAIISPKLQSLIDSTTETIVEYTNNAQASCQQIEQLESECEEGDLLLHEMMLLLYLMIDIDQQMVSGCYSSPEVLNIVVPEVFKTEFWTFSPEANTQYDLFECKNFYGLLSNPIELYTPSYQFNISRLKDFWLQNRLVTSNPETVVKSLSNDKVSWDEIKADENKKQLYLFLQTSLMLLDSPLVDDFRGLFAVWKKDFHRREVIWYARHRKCFYEEKVFAASNKLPPQAFVAEVEWCRKEEALLRSQVERFREIVALDKKLSVSW